MGISRKDDVKETEKVKLTAKRLNEHMEKDYAMLYRSWLDPQMSTEYKECINLALTYKDMERAFEGVRFDWNGVESRVKQQRDELEEATQRNRMLSVPGTEDDPMEWGSDREHGKKMIEQFGKEA